MKKIVFACTLVMAVFSLMVLTPAVTFAAKVTLTYSNFFPPTHVQSQLAESWCKEVAKRTEGRVEVQYFPGETLAKAKQTYDAVTDGIADIGFSLFAYTRGRFPVIGTIDLPLGYPSGRAATAAINAVYEKFNPKELDDVQVMYLHAHGPGMIHTKDKAVRKLEDMKGLKLRGTGYSAEAIKALGGTPVPMPMPESYQSLQKGVVDGGAFPAETNKGWKLGEVVKNATYCYDVAYTTGFYIVMNKDKWNSIPAKDQKTIQAINKEWQIKHSEAWDNSDAEGIRFFLQQGNAIIGLNAKESQRWVKAVAPVIENYQKELDKKGLDGKAVIDFIKTTLEKY
ncbi:MAG: TRAP transporter substrate-binding protein [Desulfobacteraceae bacterium]|jgi:TRAP-type C4-dicarboxylate transport system substrate-binding protein